MNPRIQVFLEDKPVKAIEYENDRQRVERYICLTHYYEAFLSSPMLSDRVTDRGRVAIRCKLSQWSGLIALLAAQGAGVRSTGHLGLTCLGLSDA